MKENRMADQHREAAAALDSHADLSHAGAVVDKAIEYMLGQNLDPMAVASALLGGSLGLLARTMGEDAIEQVLHNALRSVRAGELRPDGPQGAAGRA
jgi:hypothetical protein